MWCLWLQLWNGNCELTLYLTLELLPAQYYGHLYSRSAARYQPAPASKTYLEVPVCCGLDLDLDDADDASASYEAYADADAGAGVNDDPVEG